MFISVSNPVQFSISMQLSVACRKFTRFLHRAWTTATQSWPRRQRRSLMSCSGYWMPQHVWSLAPASTIEVCHGCSTMNCTGLTFLSGCSTSLPWPFTDVSGVKHRRTLPINAFPSLKSLVASTYDPPDANNWMYHASAVLSVVAPLHPPVRQSGIHCRIIFAIRLSDRTSFSEN